MFLMVKCGWFVQVRYREGKVVTTRGEKVRTHLLFIYCDCDYSDCVCY
jgi:hypothetical protein